MYVKGAEWKYRRRVGEEARVSKAAAFQAYGWPLGSLTSFEYLMRVLTASNNDWSEVVNNLRKSWRKLESFSRIWCQEGANARTYGASYKKVV